MFPQAATVDPDRLIALLPLAEPTGTRHVGANDVDNIEAFAAALARQDYMGDTGWSRAAAVAQLRAALLLLEAQVPAAVRPRLLVATGSLALMAGYLSFQADDHDAARRLWAVGLDLAHDSGDPRGADLTVYLLYDMGLQAVELDRPDEALRFVQLGHTSLPRGHSR